MSLMSSSIFHAVFHGDLIQVQCIVRQSPECLHVASGWSPLDLAIAFGQREIAEFVVENGAHPNAGAYRDRMVTPIHYAAKLDLKTDIFVWVFDNKHNIFLPSHVLLHIKDTCGRTPLDVAIAHGCLETVQFFWGRGGEANFDLYRHNFSWTPIHNVVWENYAETLAWVFANNVVPLAVLDVRDEDGLTPWELATSKQQQRTQSTVLISAIHVCAMLRLAKRDPGTLLSKLPVEILDVIGEMFQEKITEQNKKGEKG